MLVTLLDDPDAVVYDAVVSHILEQGKGTVPYLEKVWAQNEDAKVRERIETIIQQIQLQETLRGMQKWIAGPHHNLLEGAYWLAKQRYPGLKLPPLLHSIDGLLKDIWVGVSDEELPLFNKLNIFNHLFYRTYLFTNTDDQQMLAPAYCFINRVLETKCGNGISLGLLYLYLAQQTGFRIHGVCLPDAFLLACTDTSNKVLCYVNPLNKGAWAGKDSLNDYLRKRGFSQSLKYFAPCDNVTVMLRLVEYTVFAYEQEDNNAQAAVYRAFIPLFGNRTTSFMNDDSA